MERSDGFTRSLTGHCWLGPLPEEGSCLDSLTPGRGLARTGLSLRSCIHAFTHATYSAQNSIF